MRFGWHKQTAAAGSVGIHSQRTAWASEARRAALRLRIAVAPTPVRRVDSAQTSWLTSNQAFKMSLTVRGPELLDVYTGDRAGDDQALDLGGSFEDRVVPLGPSSASGEALFVLVSRWPGPPNPAAAWKL